MDVLEMNSYETVLLTVRRWAPNKRFALLQDIINTLSPEMIEPRPKRSTLERALGLLSTDRPAPSDTEVRQFLDEHRAEKYG